MGRIADFIHACEEAISIDFGHLTENDLAHIYSLLNNCDKPKQLMKFKKQRSNYFHIIMPQAHFIEEILELDIPIIAE